MNYRVVEYKEVRYIECLAGDGRIESECDALDLIGICGEHVTHRLLLHEENLSEDFFNLKTGLAGAVLQKLINYWVKTAAVLPPERANAGRFGEMVLEANRSSQHFHVFADRQAAADWLAKA